MKAKRLYLLVWFLIFEECRNERKSYQCFILYKKNIFFQFNLFSDYDFVEDDSNGTLSEDDFENVELASCSSLRPRIPNFDALMKK